MIRLVELEERYFIKKGGDSISWPYSKRITFLLLNHITFKVPFLTSSPVISAPTRLSLLFYLFRLSTLFWKLAQISRQFTLYALRRFPPSRSHSERRNHPNGSRYRLIRLRPPSHPYDVLMGLTPGYRLRARTESPRTCVARSIVRPPPGCWSSSALISR